MLAPCFLLLAPCFLRLAPCLLLLRHAASEHSGLQACYSSQPLLIPAIASNYYAKMPMSLLLTLLLCHTLVTLLTAPSCWIGRSKDQPI